MANFCESCGTRLTPDAVFCPACGHRCTAESADTPQNPVQQTPPYRSPAPLAQQPSAKEGKRKSPMKHSKGVIAVALILCVVLAVEFIIAAVWYPGFLNPQVAPPADGGSADDTDYADTPEFPDIKSVNIDYTDEERAQAPSVEMKVSPEEPAVSSDGFGADFGPYGLSGDDTFTVRTLPVHTFEDEFYSVQGFDLSLESGTDVFPTEVTVTIPRDENDGDLVTFITKDPETGENAEEYYEISDDGSSYILYTSHFSEHDKMVISDFGKQFAQNIKDADLSQASTREALSSFYYTSYVPWNKRMTAPVAFSQYDLWSKLMNRYTYLPSAEAMLKAMGDQVGKDGIGSVDFSGALFDGAKEISDKVDIANNAKSTADGAAEIMKKLSMRNFISPGFMETINKYKTVSDKFGKGCAVYSIISTAIGIINLNDKITKELKEGKFSTEEDAVKAHAMDYSSIILSIVGTGIALFGVLTAGTALSPVLAIGGGLVSLGGLFLYFFSESKKDPYADLSVPEQCYRDYYALSKTKELYRRFYIGKKSDFKTDSDITANSVGVIKPLKESVTKDQSERFTNLVNVKLASVNSAGGFLGAEPRWGITRDFALVCDFLYSIMQESPEKVGDAFNELFRNYADACFDNLNDSEFMSFSSQAMQKRGYSSIAALPWNNSEEKDIIKEKYAERFTKELWGSCSELFLLLSRKAQHNAQLAVNQSIRENVLPMLNTQMEFTVEDPSLDNPASFKDSVYCADPELTGINTDYEAPDGETYSSNYKYNYDYPLSFRIKNKDGEYERLDVPVFMPGQDYSRDSRSAGLQLYKTQYIDYYPAKNNFIPFLRSNSDNTVFRCTYFHWLMMGAPTALAFKDVSKKNDQPQIRDFEIPQPDSDGVIRVNIKAPANTDSGIERFVGKWTGEQTVYPSASWEHFESKTYTRTVSISLNEKQQLEAKFLLTDPDTGDTSGDDYTGYKALVPGKNCVLSDSTLLVSPHPDAEGFEQFGGYYAYKLTVSENGGMTLSTIEDRWSEENYTAYKYENTCSLKKTG